MGGFKIGASRAQRDTDYTVIIGPVLQDPLVLNANHSDWQFRVVMKADKSWSSSHGPFVAALQGVLSGHDLSAQIWQEIQI